MPSSPKGAGDSGFWSMGMGLGSGVGLGVWRARETEVSSSCGGRSGSSDCRWWNGMRSFGNIGSGDMLGRGRSAEANDVTVVVVCVDEFGVFEEEVWTVV
jgi:hypothetical protein